MERPAPQTRRPEIVRHRPLLGLAVTVVLLSGDTSTVQRTPHHEFTVTARRYAFEPARLEVIRATPSFLLQSDSGRRVSSDEGTTHRAS